MIYYTSFTPSNVPASLCTAGECIFFLVYSYPLLLHCHMKLQFVNVYRLNNKYNQQKRRNWLNL